MNFALDHLAASAADELLLDDPDLLLAEEDGNFTADIRWDIARTDLAAKGWPLDAV
jgi:hypothetical protein